MVTTASVCVLNRRRMHLYIVTVGIAAPPRRGIPALGPGAAPEAATWGMMLTGFAGLGFVGYWRKRGGGAPTFAA
jgi:hypothetical protein